MYQGTHWKKSYPETYRASGYEVNKTDRFFFAKTFLEDPVIFSSSTALNVELSRLKAIIFHYYLVNGKNWDPKWEAKDLIEKGVQIGATSIFSAWGAIALYSPAVAGSIMSSALLAPAIAGAIAVLGSQIGRIVLDPAPVFYAQVLILAAFKLRNIKDDNLRISLCAVLLSQGLILCRDMGDDYSQVDQADVQKLQTFSEMVNTSPSLFDQILDKGKVKNPFVNTNMNVLSKKVMSGTLITLESKNTIIKGVALAPIASTKE